jgi:hypothetical protein
MYYLITNFFKVRVRSTSLVSLRSAKPIALSMLYIRIFLPS